MRDKPAGISRLRRFPLIAPKGRLDLRYFSDFRPRKIADGPDRKWPL
jgi:hypothetical protein